MRYDLAVVGTGQGGKPLASDYAAAGKRVAVFERGAIGGTCVNVGCTPSKAFLASAHAAGRARRAAGIHVHAEVRVDFPAVMDRVRGIIDEWRSGNEKKLAAPNITLVREEAAFDGPGALSAGGQRYEAETIVLNTGCAAVHPPIPGLAGTPFLTNENFFRLRDLPPRTIVLGGGYIGLELGQGLARCGSAVTIVNTAERVLANEEPAASAALAKSLHEDGVRFVMPALTTSVAYDDGIFTLTIADGTQIAAEALLVATGRSPNVPPGAVEAGLRLDKRGFIAIDDQFATSLPNVYAIGDCAGQPQFTHVSWEDYRRIKAILAGDRSRTRADRVLGYAIFTDPQVGRAGLTHEAALAAGHDARCVTLDLDSVARAIEWNEENGFYRLVVDAQTDAILGATLVGYEAGELVHVFIAHMEAGGTWRTLERSVHIHPTYAEGLPTLARQLM
jgi:dihydrolipoamide dehydrogenase